MSLQTVTFTTTAEVDVPSFPSKDVTALGTAAGRSFARLPDGTEITVGGTIGAAEMGNPTLPGEVHIVQRQPSGQHVGPQFVDRLLRCQTVPAGSFEAARAQDAARARDRARAQHPPRQRVDALAYLPLLRHDPGTLTSLLPVDAANELLPGKIIGRPGKPAARGPAQILARLDGVGVRVELDPSGRYLVCWSRFGRIKSDARDLLNAAEPLLRAFLAKDPLRCQLAHKEKQAPEAVTLLEPSGMPACGACADEEVAAD